MKSSAKDRDRGGAVPGGRGKRGRFLARTSAEPLNRVDLAALRAFLLLHQEDPAAYEALPASIWQKWENVIVGLPRHGVVDKCPDAQP